MKKGKRVLIVPDKFKGSLTASQVADLIEKALRRIMVDGENTTYVKLPMADGGDGSMEVLENAMTASGVSTRREKIPAFDALMRPFDAPVLFFESGGEKSVFIEMAKVCGLAMLQPSERNPERTTTYGLGILMVEAVRRGVSHIIMGIGGSSTNDGGEGLLRAVGGSLSGVKITVACDVDNPLLGPSGATMVYAPQKGADAAMLGRLEERMGDVAAKYGLDALLPGGGAAGGTGAALHHLGGKLVPGWKMFAAMTSLEEEIKSADIVVTGEGKFDYQSLDGKLIYGVTSLCRTYGRKPFVVCGQCSLPRQVWKRAGVADVFSLREIEPDVAKCIADADEMLSGGRTLIIGCDEAGRGPLAGPVFAAAVLLPDGFNHPLLNDSKQLTKAGRDELRPVIEREALAWGVASVDAQEIDRINILNASIKAMHLAVEALLKKLPDSEVGYRILLVDGNRFTPYPGLLHHTVIKGDGSIRAIAAASVLAKTWRDEYMLGIAKEYPQYGWEHNMAYPTEEHREAVRKYGVTKYHRLSFNLLGDDKLL